MFIFLASLVLSINSYAIIMEPTYQAANALGYQVLGEIEFDRESSQLSIAQIKPHVEELGEVCPRTQAYDPSISSFADFIVIAWSDSDFPARDRRFHSARDQHLANQRAQQVASTIKKVVKGNLRFEIVNMARRQAHFVHPGAERKTLESKQNIKQVLESAGAAPSDALGVGLFAEYSQAGKVLLWVDCHESLVRRRSASPPIVRLAQLGQNYGAY